MASNGAVVATTDLISDFTYTDGTGAVRDASFSFGDYYAAPSGYGFHFPDRIPRMCPEPATGGAGGVDAGPESPVLDASTAAMDDAGASNFMSNADAGMGGDILDAGSPPGEADAGMGGAADAGAPADEPACFTPGLTEDLTDSNWHITGLVNGAAAFAVGTVCNIDASLFDGIEFTIRGNAGNPSQLRVEIGFAGFQDLVDELGGVEMSFPYPARDAKSRLDVPEGTVRSDLTRARAALSRELDI